MDVQEINQLIQSQEADYKEINHIFTNIRKDGASRKNIKYIAEKRVRLTELFTRTSSNHARLADIEELTNHRYITSDYYGNIKQLYTQAMDYLTQCEKGLKLVQEQLYEPEIIRENTEPESRSHDLVTQLFSINQMYKHMERAHQAVLRNKPVWSLKAINAQLQGEWTRIEEMHKLLIHDTNAFSHAYFQEEMFQKLEKEYNVIQDQLTQRTDDVPTRHKAKLPGLQIPIFTGANDSWRSFYDLFTNIIHNDESISNTGKMQYLKTHIRGEAARLIKHLTVCEENYAAAWNLLTERYANRRAIMSAHISNLLHLEKVHKPNAEKLRNLHDSLKENLEALKSQGIDLSTWDPMLTKILSEAWDPDTNDRYEQQVEDPTEAQKFVNMLKFLEKRFKCLANTTPQTNTSYKSRNVPTSPSKFTRIQNMNCCWYCDGKNHDIYKCAKFRQLPVQERYKAVKDNNVCKNCLKHSANQECRSTKECTECGKKGHHSYLHRQMSTVMLPSKNVNPENVYKERPNTSQPSTSKQINKTVSNTVATNEIKTTLLATAMVKIKAIDGTTHLFRVLCDQGSEASFCTEEIAQILSYPRSKIQAEVIGIADEKPKKSNYSIEVKIEPRFTSDYKLPVTLIILPKLTSSLPNKTVQEIESDKLHNKIIADPTYNKKGPIDIILGAQEYSKLLLEGVQKIHNGIVAQNTEFGWIMSGICNEPTKATKVISMITRTTEIQQLNKFWELEEIDTNYQLSNDDQKCEEYYKETTVRNQNGTYTVRLPFKNPNADLGDSRRKAMARLIQLENRFTRDEKLKTRYQEFLEEYQRMGHMRKVPKSQKYQGKYYFPHQPVINENSLTTKLRVVFDGSSKASNEHPSLNDNMLTGPKLQQDLTSILVRWRKHKIVFMADIEKMYRFINVSDKDLAYQRILWRQSPTHAIDEYELTTVTYGTASAPYLAIRTLQQLAIDEKEKYPVASKIALQDFYVDDLLSGENSIQSAKLVQEELIRLLQAGGFNLRKWSSNCIELLENIPEETKEDKMLKIPLDETRKSLGILWSPLQDSFHFQVTVNIKENPTKRFILSEIAKLFDPLGWLAPVVINMKLIIQELWTNGAEWDRPVESNIKTRWIEIQQNLKAIESIKIPRWCQTKPESKIELHGFCDASEKAYGAVVYCRVKNMDRNNYDVTLLQAKSKVAPKKQKATLPRLELCAAQLLAQLMEKVTKATSFEEQEIYCWTDSMITLGWIKGEADRWKTFVANRVSEIQKVLPHARWNHVISAQNPADVLSRGISPDKLQNYDLWWNGPDWLKTSQTVPITRTLPEICEEIKRSYHIVTNPEPKNDLLSKFSSFQKMIRVLTYCLRMKYKAKTTELSCEEIDTTTTKIIQLLQKETFAKEYNDIKNGLQLKKGNKLSSLDPYIDTDDILRVGGRLHESNLPYNQKHPIVLPYDHPITKAIIHDAHKKTLHGGNTMTLAYIRQRYWILGGKQAVKKYIGKCVKCIRYKSTTAQQKMGILPKPRVTESFPFSHKGIDYAGPIQIRAMKGRGHKSYKGYIAVFVCLATKAIHLEVVGDLTTESCIAALRRMMARRGPISHIYSDNATNFVGAANFLYKEILEITQSATFQNAVTNMGTQWHFIPPSSPHFGGIWEAGVRSMKHHLRRVIGEQTLTYEELTTFVQQIEACLNSRPLCAQSENINDNIVLTPSHFLIGREAVGIPDPLANLNTDFLNRWKQIQKMKKDFWNSWSKDYLHQLQQRYKWKSNEENLKLGTLVLIKDENISPSKWPLAKIIELHTGNDGLTRVVTLRKASGATQKRSIHTLIPISNTTATSNNKSSKDVIHTNATFLQRKQRNNNKNKTRGVSTWFLLTMTIMQLISGATSTYTIKNIQPGFYVEQIGTASVDRGTFRVETCYERKNLDKDLIEIQSATSLFNKLCEQAQVKIKQTHCKQLYHYLLEKQTEYQRTKEYLSKINQTRRKRGLLGQLLTSVFGVNDEVYRDIDTLSKNQDKLIEAANHQTKLMISTVSQINKTEERITQKLEKFRTKLNQVIDYNMYYNDRWYAAVDNNNVNLQILDTYQLANNYITDIIKHYAGLMDIYVNKATVYSVLTPKNVSDLIASANKKLPSNLKIVQNMLLDTKIRENETSIQVYAYFPIQEITKYTMMHVTSVPRQINGSIFQYVDIEKGYVGVDYNKELYFELNNIEHSNCLHKSNHFLCFPGVVKNMQSNNNCIVNHIFNKQTATKCYTKSFTLTTSLVWKRLHMKNTWLFISKQPTIISVICDGQRQEIEVNNTGVIQIGENCIIKTQYNILAAQRSISTQVIASFSKTLDFRLTSTHTNHTGINITREEVLDTTQDQLQRIINSEYSAQSHLDHTTWKQVTVHTASISIATTMSLVFICLMLYKFGPRAIGWIGTRFQHAWRQPATAQPTSQGTATSARPPPLDSPPARQQPIYGRITRPRTMGLELHQLRSPSVEAPECLA